MMPPDDNTVSAMERLLTAGVLVSLRVGSAMVTLPVLGSAAVPARVKAVFTLAVALLVTPVAAGMPGATVGMSMTALLSEVAVGLCFGLVLAFLTEGLLFAGSLMGVSFSFSLANLMDPNSRVETDVLGTMFSWLGILVLLAAGLHRTMLAALLRTLATLPLGHAPAVVHSGAAVANLAS